MNTDDKYKQKEIFEEKWTCYDPKKNRIAIFLRNYPWEKFASVKEEFEEKRKELFKEETARRQKKKEKIAGQKVLEFYEEDGELVPTEESLAIIESESSAGREPINFYGHLKLFTVCQWQGITKVTDVYQSLQDNPVYGFECFPGETPSYDTLARFDRLMGKFGLWGKYRQISAGLNLEAGINKIGKRLIIDTTHSKGNGKVGRKTKKCRRCYYEKVQVDCPKCVGGKHCEEPELTCAMSGIVHKNKGNVSKGVKYQIAGTAVEIPLGTLVFNGSASDGGESFERFLEKLKTDYGRYLDLLEEIYADGIYNTEANRKKVKEIFGDKVRLMSKPNPGNRKAKEIKRRGIKFKVEKDGQVKCEAGELFEFCSREQNQGRYIFSVCDYEKCLVCGKREQCCPDSRMGKTLRINRELLSLYNWEEPECGKRYKKKFNIRTCIERIIGRGKDVVEFARQYKRGEINTQAFGDRVVGLMNQIAYMAHALGKPEKMLALRYFWC